jgi:hypothetical protein
VPERRRNAAAAGAEFRPKIVSQQTTSRLTDLYALVVADPGGQEGVLRRDTPCGTMPWISDDAVLLLALREEAAELAGIPASRITVVRFTRCAAS